MCSNGRWSAPKGYDLRVPYNVPCGEIKLLRVVEPFSMSSYQKDTVTERNPYVKRRCKGEKRPSCGSIVSGPRPQAVLNPAPCQRKYRKQPSSNESQE